MFLGYFRRYKRFFLFLFLVPYFYVQQLEAAAGSKALDMEPSPSGGTWRAGFGVESDRIHEELCKYEIRAASPESDNNIAVFRLMGTKSDSSQVLLLESDPILSGRLPQPDSIKIVEKKVTFEFISNPTDTRTSLYNKLKKSPGQGDTLVEDMVLLESWYKSVDETVKELKDLCGFKKVHIDSYPIPAYGAKLSSGKETKNVPNAYGQLYDSEQTLIRLLDFYFAQNPDLSAFSEFTLYVHSRLDMCRYCLRCMHERAKSPDHWRKNLGLKQLRVFVSSRQEYSKLFGLSSISHSMRFVGLDDRSHEVFATDAAADAALVNQGIIFQTAIKYSSLLRIEYELKQAAAAGGAAAAGDGAVVAAAAAGGAGEHKD